VTYPTRRDEFEAKVNLALTGFYNDIKDGVPRRDALPPARHAILRAWEKSVLGRTTEQRIRHAAQAVNR
jgi:hypothetical protein